MNILLIGIVLFFGVHLIPSFVALRNNLIARLGENKYKALYSITALIGLILIIYGMSKAEYVPVWQPPTWARNAVIITMLISFYLFAAADMKSNIKRFIRHPMLSGVLLWSGAHLLANGDLASIILFGSFATYSITDMVSANIRGAVFQQETYPIKRDVVSIVAGIIAYAVFVLFIHPYWIGVPVV